ncbi:MAG: hypothetical protein FJ216_02840 [Ignavibacteria bacterium]|nr:hypothetical protein [Ignavibacteria bacterium]
MLFGITGNVHKENATEVINNLYDFLKAKRIEFLIEKSFGNALKDPQKKKCLVPLKYLLRHSEIIISLGGDGTFLNTANLVGRKNIPVLGVNLGSLGFMAEVSPDEINDFILDIIKGKSRISELCVITAQSKHKKINAINEILVDKYNSVRMLELEIFCNREKVSRFVADGVMISTPTGSTGYSLSAGGSIISPNSKVLAITPICPHVLTLRPLIVPDDSKIHITAKGEKRIRVSSDGFNQLVFDSPAEISVHKAEHTIKIIKRLNRTYFQTLTKKLLWAADKRKYSK